MVARYGVGPDTLRRWRAAGMPHIRTPGNRYRYRLDALEAWERELAEVAS